ncbi:MAG: hypothetical protein ACOC04_00605 [Halothece sp.]
MRTRTFASRLFLAIGIVAPTIFLSALAEAKPVANFQRFESPNLDNTTRRDVNFAPRLDSKLGGFTGGTSPNESWYDSWAESIDDDQLRNVNQPVSTPSAVETFRNFDNVNHLR